MNQGRQLFGYIYNKNILRVFTIPKNKHELSLGENGLFIIKILEKPDSKILKFKTYKEFTTKINGRSIKK